MKTLDLWQCPTCGYLMTADESKGYRGCPTGMHAAKHERVCLLSKPAVQRLEAWMREVTDTLAYQPDIPMTHKTCVVDALMAFTREVSPAEAPTPSDNAVTTTAA